MQRRQNVASDFGIQKEIGGNHAFFRDNKASIWKKAPYIANYSTIMSFHQIRSRERAKYDTVIHCSVLVRPVYNRVNTGNDISLAFCVVYVIRMRHNGQIMPGVFQHCYQNREAKITNSFCSGIINLLFDGFTYNPCGHFAHCSYFSSPRRNSQNIRAYYM